VFTSTGHYINPKYWDPKAQLVREAHWLHEQINLDIAGLKKQALENIIDAGVKKRSISAIEVKEQSLEKLHDIFEFAEKVIKELTGKRTEGTFKNWRKHLKKLKLYLNPYAGEEDIVRLSFEQITPDFLTDFEYYLRNKGVKHRQGKDTNNYVFAIMKTLRGLFNYARNKKKLSIPYPFSDYEMPEQTHGNKDHLSLAELDKWEQYAKTVTNPLKKQAAIYFLFGCYTGLRISDWYRFDIKKRVHKDYINIRAKKNGQWVSTPHHARLLRTIELMKQTPLTEPEPRLNKTFKTVAREAGIDKYLSSHCGRKSFAVTICLERGISSETAAELMGITLAVFVKSYSKVTPQKIKAETSAAWKDL
jgi:site-specific recombinase XerD